MHHVMHHAMHHVLLPRQVGLSTAVLTRRFSSVGRALTGVTLGTFAIYFAWTAPPHVTWGGSLCHVGRQPLSRGAAASVTWGGGLCGIMGRRPLSHRLGTAALEPPRRCLSSGASGCARGSTRSTRLRARTSSTRCRVRRPSSFTATSRPVPEQLICSAVHSVVHSVVYHMVHCMVHCIVHYTTSRPRSSGSTPYCAASPPPRSGRRWWARCSTPARRGIHMVAGWDAYGYWLDTYGMLNAGQASKQCTM